ncbi:8515_t:CDS:2 [Gigaspora rosea]|nr:8515_t:CDS:2 [Gigaspora rosea]
MANAQFKIDLLEQNSKLVAEISELKKKYTEVEAKNVKLRLVMEENTDLKTRLEVLEKKNKTDTTILIAENEASPTKDTLPSSACSELPVISQSSTSTIETYSDEENYIGSMDPNLVQNVISFEMDLDNTPKQIVNITSVTSNLSEIEKSSETASSFCTKLNYWRIEMLINFWIQHIKNEIRERNQEKKFRSQNLSLDNISQSNKNKVTEIYVRSSKTLVHNYNIPILLLAKLVQLMVM